MNFVKMPGGAAASLIQRQMIFWTIGLVLLGGIAVALSLLQPPETHSTRTAMNKKTGRTPASLVEATAAAEEAVNTAPAVLEFNVKCGAQEPQKLSSNVQQVRLLGERCKIGANLKVRTYEIKNDVNGFIATVFFPDEHRFATDYISLNPGENRIKIGFELSDGTRDERELIFSR